MGLTIEEEVFAQHVLEAGFLWSIRDSAARDPSYDLPGLCDLDERLEANLDGLRLAGDAGWEHCKAALSGGEAGEVFAATVIAVDRGDLRRVAHVLNAGGGDPELARGIVSALGWSSFDRVRPLLPGLFHGRCPPALQYLGVAACAAHRRDPGPSLGYAVVAGDARLKARALRAAGDLGRVDLLPEIRAELGARANNEPVRFAAAWSAALFGDPASAQVLWELASRGGPLAEEACDMAVRRMDAAHALTWLRSLAGAGWSRTALAGAAALGDPAIVPWLLECAEVPDTARLAGSVLSMITGVDLAAEKATSKPPEGFRAGPTDDPADSDVATAPEDDLPWPDAAALRALWRRESGRFTRGVRYLLGKPMTPQHLRDVLKTGTQPARAGAALELSVRERGRAIFEVRAPGFRQRGDLA